MKSIRTLIILLVLALLLSSVPTTGRPTHAAEPLVGVAPTARSVEPLNALNDAEPTEPPLFSAFSAPSAPSAVQSPAASNWHIECADCPKYFSGMTDRSLRLDTAGHPHIVYGGDHLYHAWHDGVTWHYETVDDAPGVGRYASLALDGGGYPHISYYDYADYTNGDLKYAYQDASGWHIETVDGGGNVGRHTSLALDGSGYAHISYCLYDYIDDQCEGLKYAYQDASGWHIQTVDSEGEVGWYTSLALDANGYPHISYHDYGYYDEGALKYAYLDASGWHTQTVDSEEGVGRYTSLALDGSGYPHISYLDYTNDDLKYAYQDVFGWHTQTVDSEGDVGWYTSLALDGVGYPHISYLDYTNGDLKYAYLDASGWYFHTLDSRGDVGYYTSLALDGVGYPHISYFDESNNALKYAYRDASGWHFQTVDSEGSGGWRRYSDTSLALDESGYPHISYYNKDLPIKLKYAFRDESGWHSEVVFTGARACASYCGWEMATSMILDGDSHAHISFWDFTCGYHDLKYAYRDTSGWHVETVDSEGKVGGYNSLALGSDGYPHISYQDSYNSDLKYAYQDTSGWHFQTVDSEGGRYTSLALDENGYPHISYFDSYNDDLKYAYRDASGWHIQTVDGEGDVGYHTSLALDGSGYPHISYYDNINYDLKYAYRDASGWHIQTVDSGRDVGMYSSLVLDGDGYPHISYYDDANRDLRYAYYSSTLTLTTYLPLVLSSPPRLKDQITKVTVTLPQPLEEAADSFCTWGGCSVSPRLYHEPLADDRTLVGWTDSSGNGHISVISGDTIERTFDFSAKSIRGLVAHDDGTFAVLLWNSDSKVNIRTIRDA